MTYTETCGTKHTKIPIPFSFSSRCKEQTVACASTDRSWYLTWTKTSALSLELRDSTTRRTRWQDYRGRVGTAGLSRRAAQISCRRCIWPDGGCQARDLENSIRRWNHSYRTFTAWWCRPLTITKLLQPDKLPRFDIHVTGVSTYGRAHPTAPVSVTPCIPSSTRLRKSTAERNHTRIATKNAFRKRRRVV